MSQRWTSVKLGISKYYEIYTALASINPFFKLFNEEINVISLKKMRLLLEQCLDMNIEKFTFVLILTQKDKFSNAKLELYNGNEKAD